MAQQQNFDNGQRCCCFVPFQVNSPSLWVQNHHVNIAKDHRLERMTVWQRELKKIKGKDSAMAIVVTAPGTEDDVDTTELYTLENHF